jgi:hypothetical protein
MSTWLPVAYAILLTAITFLLWRQQRQRDFYVVCHLGYDLVFKEHPGVNYLTADRGPLIAGCSRSFSEFGAAKAFFEHIEEPSPPNHTTEEVNSVYVVRSRKPPNESFLGRAYEGRTSFVGRVVTEVKPPGSEIMRTPFSVTLDHRRAACEERRALPRRDLT